MMILTEETKTKVEVKTIPIRTVQDVPGDLRIKLASYVKKLESDQEKMDPYFMRLFVKTWHDKSPEYIFQSWAESLSDLHLLLLNGQVIGFGLSQQHHPWFSQTAYLQSLYVEPEYRNQGFGGMFLDRILKYMRARGAINISVNVFKENQPAQAVYKKVGFQPKSITMINFK